MCAFSCYMTPSQVVNKISHWFNSVVLNCKYCTVTNFNICFLLNENFGTKKRRLLKNKIVQNFLKINTE